MILILLSVITVFFGFILIINQLELNTAITLRKKLDMIDYRVSGLENKFQCGRMAYK